MSFVTVGGEASSSPTFFELVAADRLLPSLKAAITYSLSVYAQRRPSLLRLLDSEDELFFLVSAWLHRSSLISGDASFSEGLYGLHRVPASSTASASASGNSEAPLRLNRAQRASTLALLTLVPYIRAKLDAQYERHNIRQEAQRSRTGSTATDQGLTSHWRTFFLRAFLKAYPWCVAAHEGSRFGYQLLYLLGRTPYYSPGLHLLGLRIARTDPVSAQAHAKALAARRARRAARGNTLPVPLRTIRAALLKMGYAIADNARAALILSVFAFKLLEWWYSSGERALGEGKALEPPPPPPPLVPSPEGLPLPRDPALCTICQSKRVNPTLVAPSGYVYCYACIHRQLTEHGCCPVTLELAKLSDLWRLYPGM